MVEQARRVESRPGQNVLLRLRFGAYVEHVDRRARVSEQLSGDGCETHRAHGVTTDRPRFVHTAVRRRWLRNHHVERRGCGDTAMVCFGELKHRVVDFGDAHHRVARRQLRSRCDRGGRRRGFPAGPGNPSSRLSSRRRTRRLDHQRGTGGRNRDWARRRAGCRCSSRALRRAGRRSQALAMCFRSERERIWEILAGSRAGGRMLCRGGGGPPQQRRRRA